MPNLAPAPVFVPPPPPRTPAKRKRDSLHKSVLLASARRAAYNQRLLEEREVEIVVSPERPVQTEFQTVPMDVDDEDDDAEGEQDTETQDNEEVRTRLAWHMGS